MEYPQRLSRGLALVKWWLLAIPQYIIIGLFTGGMPWLEWRIWSSHGVLSIAYQGFAAAFGGPMNNTHHGWGALGLIGIVAVIAAVVLLVTGRYPARMFDFVVGMNRWVLRVAGYAGLMTDKYPPFRLDMGARSGHPDPAANGGGPWLRRRAGLRPPRPLGTALAWPAGSAAWRELTCTDPHRAGLRCGLGGIADTRAEERMSAI